ncbi:heavy-metal-associated domain-containing protein [Micromonospora sp. NBC_01655]|uniref:heavy-metal-associated domain-containing protein n=1 Tax=Micromonospora sp. NBC_01655 TaxID=2975983 RepID=UPI002B1CD3EB|nr:heavy-metal-associated domain-containing protein [Micromonospora sp. NBC_01655]
MCGTDDACTCSTQASTTTTAAATRPGNSQQVFQVSGMTCGGCASQVSKQLAEVPGVSDVSVDAATGTVTITSSAPVDADAVAAAVSAVGYQLVH